MTIDKVIELLKTEYEKATESNYVYNPLAYALYQVWKIADKAEKPMHLCSECEIKFNEFWENKE